VSEVDKFGEDAVAADAAGPAAGLDVRIAQELIEKARVSLVGEGGLLQQVTRTVL
jgi:putative transposase